MMKVIGREGSCESQLSDSRDGANAPASPPHAVGPGPPAKAFVYFHTQKRDMQQGLCLLPIAYCLLPFANCQLPTANCLFPSRLIKRLLRLDFYSIN